MMTYRIIEKLRHLAMIQRRTRLSLCKRLRAKRELGRGSRGKNHACHRIT